MSAIALLDVSGADAAFAELVALAQAAAAQWAAQHPGAANVATAAALAPRVSCLSDALLKVFNWCWQASAGLLGFSSSCL